MDAALKAILTFLLNRRYIGGRHFPEAALVRSRTKWLSKPERQRFAEAYGAIQHWLIRAKKRTGKASEWHISIDPHRLGDVKRALDEGERP